LHAGSSLHCQKGVPAKRGRVVDLRAPRRDMACLGGIDGMKKIKSSLNLTVRERKKGKKGKREGGLRFDEEAGLRSSTF